MPLPEPHPDVDSLDLLVSVGELGSISAAAVAHGVTQPAASMRLRSLERRLQIPLLRRTTSGTHLTAAGAATAEWAGAVLGAMRTLLAGTAALRTDRGTHLRLAASLTVAEYLMPQWLNQLGGIQVSLEMGNSAYVAELVARGDADLGFIEGPRPPGRLRSKELLNDELVIVVGISHPWSRRRRPVSVRELAATPLVLREPGSGTREVLASALRAHGLEATVAMELGSTTAIKGAVMAGSGPAAVSALTVQAELQARHLVTVPCEDLVLQRSIRAIWVSSRSLTGPPSRLLAIATRSGHSFEHFTLRAR